jgi:hypothetical protein
MIDPEWDGFASLLTDVPKMSHNRRDQKRLQLFATGRNCWGTMTGALLTPSFFLGV